MHDLQSRVAALRADFPLLDSQDIVYLDNSATSQRPTQVLEAEKRFYEEKNANPFRGVYELSEACTEAYEAARTAVADFIHAKQSEEIIFTRNATESLNLVAYSYGLNFLKPGDEIVVSVMEHHSNFLPWRYVAERTGAILVKLEPTPQGAITDEILDSVLNERTRLVALTQMSNVLGQVYDLKHIAERVHAVGAVLVADGAQSVPHLPVDVQALDVDFLAFSGHKMLAPTGIGVLYGKLSLLKKMPPFLQGGEMIEIVHWDRVKYAQPPHKFEAGTVNTGGAVALHAAIDYIRSVGFDTIMAQEEHLTRLAMEGMRDIPGVHIMGSPEPQDHQGIVTFTIDGVHPHDVASIFDAEHICVRAGHHCAQPLMDFLGVFSTTRASFSFYNTEEDVARFLACLGKIRRQMGYGE
ncbi:MAG: cysteine desulfurase [Oscillospiraceae bacterium]|nr:cysteine desulfurase [Oscillospiraceae bacterium]